MDDTELFNLQQNKGTLTTEVLHADPVQVDATVSWIDPQPDPITGKKRVYCDLPTASLPEVAQSASNWELQISLADPDGGLVIPRAYLIQRFDQWYVQTSNGAMQAVVVLAHHHDEDHCATAAFRRYQHVTIASRSMALPPLG